MAQVRRHQAQQFLGVVARRAVGPGGHRGGMAVPLDVGQDLARDAQRVAIVFGQVVAQSGDRGVHLGAAELLLGGDLAGGCLQQRGAGKKGARAPAHEHDVVRQTGLVGPASGRRAVGHGHHRQPGGRHQREVAEGLAAAHEVLDPVGQQVGTGALDELHVGQLVLERDRLGAQDLVQAHGLQRAGVDAGVRGQDHAAQAADVADAGDHTAPGHAARGVLGVQAIAGQRAQLEEGGAGVQQQRDALARQQLAALLEARARRLGRRARALLQRAHLLQLLQHRGAARLELGAGGRERGFDDRHDGDGRWGEAQARA